MAVTRFIKKYYPEFIVFTFFLAIQLQHLNADFWNDELYTLENFTLVPVFQTLTDYHVPNNHVFFNLLNNLYLKITGWSSLHDLMDRPAAIRILTLVYASLLFFFCYYTAKKSYSRAAGLITTIVLSTTIPYFNFALQIRGYGLSMLLLVGLLLAGLQYLRNGKPVALVVSGLVSCALVYTIPSNIYAVCGMLLFLGAKALAGQLPGSTQRSFRLGIAISSGLGLALLCYAVVFKDVFMNEYVQPGVPFQANLFSKYLPEVFEAFVSERWILIYLAIAGLISSFKSWGIQHETFLMFPLVFLVPFIMCYVRGDQPPVRTFSVLIPVFCLSVSFGVAALCDKFKRIAQYKAPFLFLLLAYSVAVFGNEKHQIADRLLYDIKIGSRAQNLYHQYYSAHYHPLKDVRSFKHKHYKKDEQLVIIGCEPHGIPHYLEKFDIPYRTERAFDSLLAHAGPFIILTSRPHELPYAGEYQLRRLNDELSYHNFIRFEKNTGLLRNLKTELAVVKQQVRDSVMFILNMGMPQLVTDVVGTKNSYVIGKGNKDQYGMLLNKANATQFICYVETTDRNSANTRFMLSNGHRLTKQPAEHLFLMQKTGGTASGQVQFYNRFETAADQYTIKKSIDSAIAHSGKYSQRLDPSTEYSVGFTASLHDSDSYNYRVLSAMAKFEQSEGGLVVMEVNRKTENLLWKSVEMNKFYTEGAQWHRIVAPFKLDTSLNTGDTLKLYIWNPNKDTIYLDDIKVGRVPNSEIVP